jgi:2-hydroxychromene-2-carboxylate isomerase
MWEEPKKMDEPEVFRLALESSGLDANFILQRIRDDQVKQILIANTERSVARGTFGLPTLFVGREMFFGKDQLRAVEECILEQKEGDE